MTCWLVALDKCELIFVFNFESWVIILNHISPLYTVNFMARHLLASIWDISLQCIPLCKVGFHQPYFSLESKYESTNFNTGTLSAHVFLCSFSTNILLIKITLSLYHSLYDVCVYKYIVGRIQFDQFSNI